MNIRSSNQNIKSSSSWLMPAIKRGNNFNNNSQVKINCVPSLVIKPFTPRDLVRVHMSISYICVQGSFDWLVHFRSINFFFFHSRKWFLPTGKKNEKRKRNKEIRKRKRGGKKMRSQVSYYSLTSRAFFTLAFLLKTTF